MNKVPVPQLTLVAAALVVALAVAGCSPSTESEQPTGAAPAQPTATAAEGGMTAALTQEQVGARYDISSAPVLINQGQAVRIGVSVTNAGTVAISSKGEKPVNLAVSLVDQGGAMLVQDFIRVPLPDGGIAPGSTAELVAEMPAQDVLGKTLRFGLVQESVAWYSGFNVEPLNYGPLTACEDRGVQSVCMDGKALPHAEQP